MPSDGSRPEDALPGHEFVSFLYHEIRAIARQQLARERPNHTLSATALVNELYLRLSHSDQRFASDKEFVPAAAHMLREILVDYARPQPSEARRRQHAFQLR